MAKEDALHLSLTLEEAEIILSGLIKEHYQTKDPKALALGVEVEDKIEAVLGCSRLEYYSLPANLQEGASCKE